MNFISKNSNFQFRILIMSMEALKIFKKTHHKAAFIMQFIYIYLFYLFNKMYIYRSKSQMTL